MARARGANALLAAKFETTYGSPPGGNFMAMPFVSSALGEESGLIQSDLLGQGREPYDPTPDVSSNDGDVVVPVDVRRFGQWLKLFMGPAATSAGTGGAPNSHVFTSGADVLPSLSAEVGLPQVPSYGMNFGVLGNTMRIAMGRSGLLNATLGLIAQGETSATSSAAGTPSAVTIERFAQATGQIKQGSSVLANIVSADFTFSNNLDKVEVIRADGRIAGADPGVVGMSGSITARFADTTLLDAATAGTPIDLNFGWVKGAYSLVFDVPRVFLPRVKRPVTGPAGIQVGFNWQASGQGGHACTATLLSDVATYA